MSIKAQGNVAGVFPLVGMSSRLSTIVVALRQMLRLGSAFTFGNSPEFWMNLQSHYDLKMARSDLKPGDIKA
ncbi:MAG: helix-turn-helix transcriptional regulator [Sphingobacteriales bacterium]